MSKAKRDVVLIGASAGGVEALINLLKALPGDLDAAVAVTLHRHPSFMSTLANVFGRDSKLEVIEPGDGEPFTPGRVYLAPKDRHMTICADGIHLDRGPRQHHTRPAIDPMFISAADTYGARVIGVLLTGNLSDGVSGLIHVKQLGGLSLVQDPSEALFPSMPRNALIYDHVDLVLRLERLPSTLAYLVGGASLQSVIAKLGVRHASADETQEPGWVARGHRLP